MALNRLPLTVMVIHDNAIGVPWIYMVLQRGFAACYLMACHETQNDIDMTMVWSYMVSYWHCHEGRAMVSPLVTMAMPGSATP